MASFDASSLDVALSSKPCNEMFPALFSCFMGSFEDAEELLATSALLEALLSVSSDPKEFDRVIDLVELHPGSGLMRGNCS